MLLVCCPTWRIIKMSAIELTEEQSVLLRELKLLDPDPPYKGLQEGPSSVTVIDPPDIPPAQLELFYEVEYDSESSRIRDRLVRYRRRSEQVYRVGELLREYEGKFRRLMEEKEELVELIDKMKGSTSQLVDRQKRMIDLSIKMKQSLDYYAYHDKFVWDYPCEVGCREMFEDSLQPTLSELTDGMHFFQENTTYAQSKKYLGQFQTSRSKLLSFVKSFFIKLFNRQQAFTSKNCKAPLTGLVDSLYPKSKIRFVSAFILLFPQFHSRIQDILKSVKESAPQQDTKFLELKQMEIYEFELSRPNLALIGYLQLHMPEVYQEAVLTYFTYYRLTLHQTLVKAPHKKDAPFPQLYSERLLHLIYLLTAEFAYQNYCCRATRPDSAEAVRSNLTAISKFYSEELLRLLRDPRNKQPFQLCEAVTRLQNELPAFLRNHMLEQYQSYTLGAVSQFLRGEESQQFLQALLGGLIQRVLQEMEPLCFNSLPKPVEANTRREVEEQVRQFLLAIPKLRFCEGQAERYLIGMLDNIVKAINQANSKMESRFECYLWNLELFGSMRGALRGVRGSLVRRELKLDVNNSAGVIDRVRGIERNDSLLKYAQEVFNVLRTGMPVINELTFDFTKYIDEHTRALEGRFVWDIRFVYAKNMIEFLHSLEEAAQKGQPPVLCTQQAVQNLYSTYLLSIQKYVKDANSLLADWRIYKIGPQSEALIPALLEQVYQQLFDLMDRFYVSASKWVSTDGFKEIEAIKQGLKKEW